MKRWILLALVAITIGLLFGSLAGQDPGFVMLSWGHYSLETSLWFFLLVLLLVFFLLSIAIRLGLLMIGSDWRFNEWRRNRRRLSARKLTMRGLISLAQGQWARAERQLTRSAPDADIPLINYLAAAKSAYELGKHDITNQLLQDASKSTKGAELPCGMAKAQFLMSRGQQEQALAVLINLRDKYPRHSYLLKMLARLYQDLEDWVALNELLPVLGKSGPFSAEQLHELSIKVYLQLIERQMRGQSGENPAQALKKLFHSLPRTYRESRRILLAYGSALHESGEDELAESELRVGMKHAWSDELIRLYGKLEIRETERQRLFAEQQLKERPNDPTLLLSLARICTRLGDLDAAQEFVATGLNLKRTPELLVVEAELLMQQGQYEAAAQGFQKALAKQTG